MRNTQPHKKNIGKKMMMDDNIIIDIDGGGNHEPSTTTTEKEDVISSFKSNNNIIHRSQQQPQQQHQRSSKSSSSSLLLSMSSSSSSSSSSSFPNTKESCRLFNKYELYGWKPDPNLSDDENFMDLVLIVTRSSQTTQGSMACIIVQQPPSSPAERDDEGGEEDKSTTTTTTTTNSFHDNRIISVATNGPLFTEKDSDIHAEIAALGQVCRRSCSCSCSCSSCNDTTVGGSSTTSTITTQNATAYITMPPCKRCFAALVCAGITRIVSRLPAPTVIMEAAKRHHINMVATGNIKQQMSRINQLIYGNPDGPNKETNTQKKRQGGGGGDESTSTTKENYIKRKQPKLDEKIQPI